MQSQDAENRIKEASSPVSTKGDPFFVPTVTPAMRAVERAMSDIAGTELPVLVIGESGTGKGAVALRIHELSRRSQEPFVKINCAALTSEFLNGGTPGTGNGGMREWPHVGTVFLDEIGELNLACQPKVLYALPEDGVSRPQRPEVRVISSTRRNLEVEMRDGRFREDLYYRISGVCLRLPPLRQRKEDIPALVHHFLEKYAIALNRPKPGVSAASMRLLMEYPWPGNIRELEYSVQKIIALGDEQVALEDLRRPRRRPLTVANEGISLKQTARAASRQAERELILQVLSRTRWNRKRAAEELQISYKALLYKLKQIGIDSTGS